MKGRKGGGETPLADTTLYVDADGQRVYPGHSSWTDDPNPSDLIDSRLGHTPIFLGCVGQFELAWDSAPYVFFGDSDQERRDLEGMQHDPIFGALAREVFSNWLDQSDELAYEADHAAPEPGMIVLSVVRGGREQTLLVDDADYSALVVAPQELEEGAPGASFGGLLDVDAVRPTPALRAEQLHGGPQCS